MPLCFDLGRRLAGPVAGGTAAVIVATSQLLGIYGSFGRMYSLFAFASALAVDLFVRAAELRTQLAAAASAWLLPAIHPFGLGSWWPRKRPSRSCSGAVIRFGPHCRCSRSPRR